MASKVTRLSEAAIARAPAEELREMLERTRSVGDTWIRRMVVERKRIDILATQVLGYDVQPFHLRMMLHQFKHRRTLQLAFRGAGKSTTCTITKAIHLVLCNPNLRILIASKSTANAEAFLKEIKGHFERNERLIRIFGTHFDPRRVGKWDTHEIEVLPRTLNAKEATITCAGVDGTIVARHYDVILGDDLVDENNSRTPFMRNQTRTWFYQTLDPTLEPPDPKVPERGQMHLLGTRYHFADLWGHLTENDMRESTQVIPALDGEGLSPWPEKYPPEYFEEKKKSAGVIVFGCQYQCDAEAMKGEVFRYDDCQPVDDKDIPSSLVIFTGFDLAIGEEEHHDKFAYVKIGVDRRTENIYVLDWWQDHLRFHEQKQKIINYFDADDPVRSGVEVVGYQRAQLSEVIRERPELKGRIIGVDQAHQGDKMTRAQKLSATFDAKKMFFRRTGNMHLLVEQLVLMPGDYDDGFDALEIAVRVSRMRRRKRTRSVEPGVL